MIFIGGPSGEGMPVEDLERGLAKTSTSAGGVANGDEAGWIMPPQRYWSAAR